MAAIKFTITAMMATLLLVSIIQLSFVPTHNDRAIFPRSTHSDLKAQKKNAFTLDGKSVVTSRKTKATSDHGTRAGFIVSALDEDSVNVNSGSIEKIISSDHINVNSENIDEVSVRITDVNRGRVDNDLLDVRNNGLHLERDNKMPVSDAVVNAKTNEISLVDKTEVNAKLRDLELQGEQLAPTEIGANRIQDEVLSKHNIGGRSHPVSLSGFTLNGHQSAWLALRPAPDQTRRENDAYFGVPLDSRRKGGLTPSFKTEGLVNEGREIENDFVVANTSKYKLPLVSGGFERVIKDLNVLKMRSKELQKSVDEIFDTFVSDTSGKNRNTIRKRGNESRSALIQGKVFWSDVVEGELPKGIPESEVRAWRIDVRTRHVKHLLPGCGRERNRLAILDNGEKLCIRYRQNVDQILGEVLSFYLSRLLAIDNVPLSVLLEVNRHSDKWISVKENITKAGWEDGIFVVATKYVPDLTQAYMPLHFRGKNRTLDSKSLRRSESNMTLDNMLELAQWSDLIVFDYLTANLDRIVNAHVNSQWNRYMFEQPVHNLEMSSTSDQHPRLLFLDNESGMLHGYRMLPRYGRYHDQIVKSLCIFRANTVYHLLTLNAEDSIWNVLKTDVDKEEPLFDKMPSFPLKFRDTLRERVAALVEHIAKCKSAL